jgi:hypothetical protein
MVQTGGGALTPRANVLNPKPLFVGTYSDLSGTLTNLRGVMNIQAGSRDDHSGPG